MDIGDIGKIRSLMHSATILNSNLNFEQLLPLIMLKAKEVLGSEASSLFLLDERKNNLYCEVALSSGGEVIQEFLRLEPGQGIAGWVAKEKKSLMIDDVYNDERFDPKWDQTSGFKTRSIICVPLFMKGRLIGTLQVINKIGGNAFASNDLELVQILADIAAVAIHNSRLHESLRKRVLELSLLTEFEKKITTDFDMRHICDWLLNKCLEVMESKTGSLMLFDSNASVLRIISSQGIPQEVTKTLRIKSGEGVSGYVAQTRKPLLIKNIETDERFEQSKYQKYETRSSISTPVLFQKKLIGVLNINNKKSGYTYNLSDLKLISTLANRIAIALRNIELTNRVDHSAAELKKARILMDQIIPDSIPEMNELKINLKHIPVNTIGGDFYKLFKLDQGRLAIALVDVCGHGLSAALLAMIANSLIATFEMNLLENPGLFFHHLNGALDGLFGDNFLTSFYCIVDIPGHKLLYSNAGHCYPVLQKKDRIIELKSKGSLIGVLPDLLFEEREIDFEPGDRLFLFTDGLLELGVSEVDGQDFIKILQSRKNKQAGELIDTIIDDIFKQTGETKFDDDVTLMVLDRHDL